MLECASIAKIRESTAASANPADVAGTAGAFIDAGAANTTRATDPASTADPDGFTFVDAAFPIVERG
jgi:hypothetical protein